VEKEIEVLESQSEKSNIKLSNTKSNKEYRAALKEIEDLNRQKSLLEDKAIELMEGLERLEQENTSNNSEMEKAKKQFEEDRNRILREVKGLEKELKKLEKERAELCQAVDVDLLREYDFLMERKGDLAISSVINSVCQTCHMGIPPQKYNELIRGDELLTCPHCHRIIYWGENERFQGTVRQG
jgi:predicted  nucleic acid-binding Zn-ribbon protein